ncbi:hypothetical protein ACN28E_54775 [Archangium lansingense]|uniref:hypothetical protein n=1 Tax=Archangium lansingense TaxID=2995310 RepID=UPI003B7D2D72
MKRFKCAECGQGQVVLVAKPGRRAAFKNIPDLEVPETVGIPTCEFCGAEWLDEDSTRRLDAALAEAYRRELSKKANCALRQLKAAKLRQWDLEPVLGLSPGYLSKVKAGKDVSPTLTAALMLLAGAPGRFVELQNAWRCSPRVEPTITAQSQAHVELSKSIRSQTEQARFRVFIHESHGGDVQAARLKLAREYQPKHTPASEFVMGLEAAA